MKKLLIISSIIFALFTSVSCKNKSENRQKTVTKTEKEQEPPVKWKKYVSKSGNFTILSPGKVTLSHKSIKTPNGNRVEVKFEYFKVNEKIFSVQYLQRMDKRMGIFAKNELKARVLGMKKRAGGIVSEQKEIKIGKFPGIELAMESKQGKKLMRLAVTPNRFYLLITNLKNKNTNIKACRTFLNSFMPVQK